MKINWTKNPVGLVPAIIQDSATNCVLMLGYMNQQAYEKTLAENRVWFFSRSKNRLWLKGETSQNYLNVVSIKTDCDNDTVLIKVRPAGPTCHTGKYSCFAESTDIGVLSELFETIQARKKSLPPGSYTASLFKDGADKICAKVEEESEEVVRATKTETKQRLIEESVDLIYHLFVLLVEKDILPEDVDKEVRARQK